MSVERPLSWTKTSAAHSGASYCLSLVVPVFNEQESIAAFIAAVDGCLLKSGAESDLVLLEYLFVNDGSRDNTELVIREIAKRDPRVRLINLSRNFGKEAALSAGLKYARGHAVIPMDVDLQDPPELIVEMIAHWRAGAKVVNARRKDRSSDTRFKRWTSSLFYRFINRLSDHEIPSNVGDFRLLDRDAVDVLNSLTEHSRFNKGLFSWIGFNVATVEYSRPVRQHGTTKWDSRKLWLLAVDAVTSSTTLPLRVWTGVGATIAGCAFVYAVFLIAYKIIFGIDTHGYASIMVAVLFLGGLNLLSLGVMGEYLGRVAVQVRGRPLFVIESTVGLSDGA